jgi:HEAT repeat protein
MDIEALFAQTLDGEYDDDAPWKAVSALREIASREVFEKASAWCSSPDAIKRARGADVLAQLGKTVEHPTNSYPEESYAILEKLAASEQSCLPLSSAIHALGHIGDARAVPTIAKYRDHSDSEIRFAVACASGGFGNEQLAGEVLLKLMQDEDSDVRDWATFGVGSLSDRDGPEIRETLFAALSDVNEDVVGEALVGLARRKDLRVLPTLFARLRRSEIDVLTVEAASWMLDLREAVPDWEPDEVITALNERFGEKGQLPGIMPE